METINGNPMSDLIYLFLDGESDSTQQQVLFKSLADNPDLQSEFQDALSLNRTMSADSKNLVPSDELSQNLFVKAGFETGAAGSGSTGFVAGTAGKTVFTGLIGKIKTAIIPASIGSVITAALLTTGMYLLNIDFNSDRHAAVNKEGADRQVITKNENQIPVVKSESVENVKESNNTSKINRRKTISVFPDETLTTSNNISSNISETKTEDNDNTPLIVIPDISMSDLVFTNDKPDLQYKNKDFTQLNIPQGFGFGDLSIPVKLNFLLEAKGINNLAFMHPRKMDESKVFLKNAAMNIYYKLSDNNYIGAGFGNENFQLYEVIDDSTGAKFLSNPNLYWISLNYRRLSDKFEFLGKLQLFAEISAAYSKWGPVLKGTVGLYYNPENSFTIGLGLEGTGLYLYKTRGDIKGTGKLALVYSFGYSF